MTPVEIVAAALAERGWWFQITHSDDGRWSWCAGDANADLTGGQGETFEQCVAAAQMRLDAGRFRSPEEKLSL